MVETSKREDIQEYKRIRNERNKYIRKCKRKWIANSI